MAGKTRRQIEAGFESKLEKSGLSNPRVSVLIKKLVSAKVSVYGEVTKPGTFPYEAGMTVVQGDYAGRWVQAHCASKTG